MSRASRFSYTKLMLLGLAPLPDEAAESPPQRVAVQRMAPTVYASLGTKPEDDHLMVTVSKPKDSSHYSDGPLPAVAFFHGGGWREGSPANVQEHADVLAAHGFIVANFQYRLATKYENRFPAAIHDAKAAIRWLRANATLFGADPARIGAVGGSAGGHLSAMLATTAGHKQLEGNVGVPPRVSSGVQAAVCWGTPFDIVAVSEVDPVSSIGALAQFLGSSYKDNPAVYELASPAYHMNTKAPAALPAPIMLMHEVEERVVFPWLQQESFDQAADLNFGFELVERPGDEHAFWVRQAPKEPNTEPADRFEEAMTLTAAFFAKTLQ